MSSTSDRPVFNDRYEVHSRIGRGGMADVFLARDRLLDRPVAVKVLFPEYATDPSFVERFRREAQAAANLTHPNIVGVYDWGRQGSTYFIVMEYVNGRTLADILKAEGSLQPQRAADIASDVAAALGFAHRNGVVHRDVKPANILVAPTGAVKVADFGIARALNSSNEQDLTQAGAVMGTATYFSPEQAQGANPDPRSDLYSLGIVMYEMVAGKPPFSGENPVAIAYKQVHDAPARLSSIKPDVPQAYEAIVMKLLAKSPANRYPASDELRADLRRFREGQPVTALSGEAAMAATTANRAVTHVQPATVVPDQVMRPGVAPTRVQPQQRVPQPAAPPPVSGYPGRSPIDRGPSRTGWYVAAGLLAAIVVAVGVFALFKVLNKKDPAPATLVTVPHVVDQPLAEAKKLLADKGLVAIDDPKPTDKVAIGVVWAQEHDGEQVAPGTSIKLTFNPDPGKVTLPNLLNPPQPKDQAAKALTDLGLQVVFKDAPSPDQPVGTVIAMDPAAGQVAPGSTVTLTVSSGKEQAVIPNVATQDPVAASNLLGTQGFTVTQAQEANDTIPVGLVIRTDPPAGTKVDKGSPVKLVVSSGAAPVPIPNVVGLTRAAAVKAIQDAGLKVGIQADIEMADVAQDGKVLEQDPPYVKDQKVPKGTEVGIKIGKFVAPTTTTTPPDDID